MLSLFTFQARRRRQSARITRQGASIIGLLIVVVIMMILTYEFLGPGDSKKNQVTQAQTYINRGAAAACSMNMTSVRTEVAQLQINNPGVTITPKLLEKKGILQKCPEGGEYVIKNGQIYCTKHNPPPPDETPAVTTSTQSAVKPEAAQ